MNMNTHANRGLIGGFAGIILVGLFVTGILPHTPFGSGLFIVLELLECGLAFITVILLYKHMAKVAATAGTPPAQLPQPLVGLPTPGTVSRKIDQRVVAVLGESSGMSAGFLFFLDGINRIKPIVSFPVDPRWVVLIVGILVAGLIYSLITVE